jgi:outer membrane protein assembly factor BamB
LTFRTLKSKNQLFGLIIICLLVSVVILSALPYVRQTNALTQPGGDWTSFTLDNSNSRYQSSSTITSANVHSLQEAWFYPTGYSITSTPVVQNGNVYFADWDGNVYSVNVNTGMLNWEKNVGFSVSSSLLLENGLVYVTGSPLGQTVVTALNENSGSPVWSTPLTTTYESDGAIYTSPIYYNGLIYVGISDDHNGGENVTYKLGEVFALNANSGSIAWNFTTMKGNAGGAAVWGSFVVDPNLNSIYFGTGNSYVNATNNAYAYSILSLNALTGQWNWNYTVYPNLASGGDQDFGSTPNLFSITVNGKNTPVVGLGNKNGHYYILNRVNGKLLYDLTLPNIQASGNIVGLAGFYPSTTSPIIFIPSAATSGKGELVAYDTSSPSFPSSKWTFSASSRVVGSVAVIPGAVLFGDSVGELYAANITNGAALYQSKLPNLPSSSGIWGGVSVAEGHVFVGDYYYGIPQSSSKINGLGLYAFAVSSSSSTTTSSSQTTTSSSSTNSLSSFGISSSSYATTFGSNLSNTLKVTLSSSTGNDVVVVFADSSATGGYDTATVSDTAGLAWNLRGHVSANPSSYRDLEEWYAVLPATNGINVLDRVSVTWGTTNTLTTTKVLAFLISGANINSPFDPSAGKPALGGNGSWATISTSNSNDIIFSYANVDNQNGFSPMNELGFTAINQDQYFDTNEYAITSTTYSNLEIAFSGTNTGSDPFAQIADAVVQNTPSSTMTSTTTTSLSSSGAATSSHSTATTSNIPKFPPPNPLSNLTLLAIIAAVVGVIAIASILFIRRRRYY